jgi:hypothetical protein
MATCNSSSTVSDSHADSLVCRRAVTGAHRLEDRPECFHGISGNGHLRPRGNEVVHELLQKRNGDVGHHNHMRNVTLQDDAQLKSEGARAFYRRGVTVNACPMQQSHCSAFPGSACVMCFGQEVHLTGQLPLAHKGLILGALEDDGAAELVQHALDARMLQHRLDMRLHIGHPLTP